MVLDEVERALRCFQPQWVLLYIIICISADEGKSPLEPHRLGGVNQTSVSIHTGIDATIHLVPTMLHPEGHNVLCEIGLVGFSPLLDIFLDIHSYRFSGITDIEH